MTSHGGAVTRFDTLLALSGLLGLVLMVSGCERAKQAANPAPSASTFGDDAWAARKAANEKNVSVVAGNTFAKVTYKPEVKIVDEALVVASLQGVSSDGHGAVFKSAPPPILALKMGDIFMVKSQFAVKVLGTQTEGDQTVLIIDRAKLVDLIQEGEIHLDSPIRFHGPKVASARPTVRPTARPAAPRSFQFMDLLATPAYAQNGTGEPPAPGALQPGFNTPKPGVKGGSAAEQAKSFVNTLTSGWTVENWSVTPGADGAALTAKITKDIAGFEGLITIDGSISNFTLAGNYTFPGNALQTIGDTLKGMSGKFNFVWEVAKKTPGVWATEDKLNLPAGLTIPLGQFVAGVPLTLDISMALLIHPALTGGNEFEHGAFTLGFNGSGNGEGLTIEVTEQKSISPVAPNAMVIAFCAPRVELQLSPLGMFSSSKGVSKIAEQIDAIVGKVASMILSPETISKIQASPFGNFSVTNALASKADAYVQIIHSAGTTNAANITPVACKKFQVTIEGQYGADAALMGMTPNAKTNKSLFTKSYTRWDPASDFCKSV